METRQSDQPVVVGFDDSVHARAALHWAVEEAAQVNAPVRIVYALEWLPEFTDAISGSTNHRVRERAEEIIAGASALAHEQDPAVEVTATVETGHPATVLCDLSASARMLVLGSRGRGGFSALLAGSVSVAVATHAKCPVVIIRNLSEIARGLPVVVGVDDSDQSQLAVRFAFAEAARRDVAVVAVRAWHPPTPDPYSVGFLRSEEIAEFEMAESRFLRDRIEAAAKAHPEVRVQTRLVVGPARTALTEAAHDAQMIVVGSRGHGGFSGLLLGSVGLHLVHYSPCPVVVVRDSPSAESEGTP
jgi:nucleotide-binding universal stress UspA family protein